MGAIGLNPIRLDRIGLDPIRINAIKLGVPGASGTERPYIDPEVLASLKAVCICYGKSNDDPDRAVVKNLVDPDNPFVISNAAYDKMSSYGGYEFAKFDNTLDWYNTEGNDSVEVVSRNGHSITLKRLTGPNFWYFQNSTFRGLISNVIPFKVNSNKNITVIWDVHGLSISEGKDKSVKVQELVLNPNEDNYTNLKTLNEEELAQIDISTNSLYYLLWFDLSTLAVDEEVTIEMLPLFEGAFVTDGIDDLITSTKTVQEMLGGSNEITVVSMIHQIDLNSTYTIATTNYIENSNSREHVRSDVYNYGKTGIYGYSASLINNTKSDIKNILGDEADYYVKSTNSLQTIFDAKFSVVGRISELTEASQVAWYWTIIANKVLTTDQINQVIAYFNLDRTLKSDIYCNIAKQGITNENHAEFGDKLIDFSGNGRDIQLNNIAWKGDSGIGKYEVDFLDSSIWNSSNSTITSSKIDCKNAISHIMLLYYSVGSKEYPDIPSFKVIKTGADIDYSYIDETGFPKSVRIVDGVNVLPASHNTLYSGSGRFCGFGNPGMGNSVTITQIPSHAGGLCLDGINDFGKVTGMPVYKDYTFISKYQRLSYREAIETEGGAVIASKSYSPNQGAFIFNGVRGDYVHDCYSFGLSSSNNLINDKNLEVYYQTKYTNQGKSISSGTAADSDILWLGTVRDNDSRFINAAIYSLMSFPYSMSEFLIERQLKKHKLGTLYPDMVEFRPIVKSNVKWNIIEIWQGDKSLYRPAVNDDKTGIYLKKDSTIGIYVKPKDADEVTKIVVNGTEYTNLKINSNGFYYVTLPITKSPQKINITIDEYIRYEDIVQPYPVLLRFKDENGNEVSWGGKFKVGSTITRIGSFNDCNLLKGIYTVSNAKLNGSPLPSTPHVVEKSMVFTCTATWAFDNNEPNCILSPRLLRIPNSSYKILGHIPDISGHGNHGVIHNSAYAEGSGVNEDGSYQLDGVDDHITIPTLSSGGKQVLMKVNSRKSDCYLYDQRNNWTQYLGIVSTKDFIAYNYSNQRGKTYIDGILNENITANDLIGITHNITVTNNRDDVKQYSPCIGTSFARNSYAQMALYDFMLFDNISTDDKIKELNEYVGIEGNVWGILTQLSNSTLISNETLIKNE